ncbi:hypothetical protein ACK3SF_02055 [Candidatus Nanosalina sp. VS9-1]|uniref:hypothetical protein n=1 Tax=Candidatus Nanosalina sp. VS9-1 TaxID=3388566 RepID=UPI0039DF47F0
MAQIGSIKVETSSGIVSVPVFDLDDASSQENDFLRVNTGSGVGFIPLADRSSAAFPYIRIQTANGVLAADDSIVEELSYYLEDDWNDNRLSSRNGSTSGGSYTADDGEVLDTARYRPEWTYDGDGLSINARNERLEITGGTGNNNHGYMYTSSELNCGTFEWDIQLGGYTSDDYHANNCSFQFMRQDANNKLQLTVSIKSGVVLSKTESGTGTTLVSNSNAIKGTTTNHTVRIEVEPNGDVELFIDDVSQGKASNSFLPDSNEFRITLFDDANDTWHTQYYIDNLRLG